MPDLSHFLGNAQNADDIGHSNGFGAAAGGGGAGGLSMEERRKKLNQPRVIGAYQYSRLGRQSSAIKARTADQKEARAYDASSDTFSDDAQTSNRPTAAIKDQAQIDKSSIERREHFIEPPSRTHDPYA